MRTCQYKNCSTKDLAGHSIALFKVPTNEYKHIWLRHSGLECDKSLPKNIYICEEHFYEKDINAMGLKKSLKKGTVPKPFNDLCLCTEFEIGPCCVVKLSIKPKDKNRLRKTKKTSNTYYSTRFTSVNGFKTTQCENIY